MKIPNWTWTQISNSFTLLLSAVFCIGAAKGNTLELPRNNEQPITIETAEVDVAGQQRYRILTNHYHIIAPCAETGKLAAEKLEHLFRVWQLLAADQLAAPPARRNRHQVVIFRDKQEYERNLFRIEPAIAQTNGFYSAPRKTTYFYLPLQEKVLFHEGTHQIISEHFFPDKVPVFRNNFWAVEGIAIFMEALRIEEESYKVGDILADKLFAARVQFERNFNLPIRRLTAMSAVNVQSSRQIREIYRKSATLVHWLMFAEEGRYRQHLFELLRQAYAGTATSQTLSELTGLSYEELDKKYVEFLQTIPDCFVP